MTRSNRSWKLGLVSFLAIGGAIAFSTNSASAQITPDATLPNNSRVTPSGNTSIIEGGTKAGSNLFHSFEQFSVPTGNTANFNNALDIQNIISRVTGKSISNIDGLIKANGTANLFLINPNGIIFGPNASLNIGGSFVASTASAVKFADGTEFSATAPQTAPLLTISVPNGLQFESNLGNIVNQSQATNSSGEPVGLQVPLGRTLALVGGDIVLKGGNLAVRDGRIELGSVAGNSLVSLTATNTGYTLGYQGVNKFQDIRLMQEAFVTTSGNSGGSIKVQGAKVTLTDGSQIEANLLGSGAGEGLTVNASKSVQLIGISADGQFPSSLYTGANGTATGKAGDLTITTPVLQVLDGAQVSTTTRSSSNAGSLNINASESVQAIGTSANRPGGLFARTDRTATGKAGDLTISTPVLIVSNGALVSADTFGLGNGGSLIVNASKSVQLIGTSADGYPSSLSTQADTTATGKAGDLTISTPVLIVSNGALVNAGTFGSGNGGSLIINASESVQLIGKSTDSRVASGLWVATEGIGKAGNLTINTKRLLIRDGAQALAATFGSGDGGSLNINASESVQAIGKSTDSRVAAGLITGTDGTGKAGDLSITTQQLHISNGAEITASSRREGVAGDLGINAISVRLDKGKITSQTRSSNGGNLKLNFANLLLLRRGSEISTSAGTAQQPGDSGNITINAPSGFIIAVPRENSDITANAFNGSGGRATINAAGIFGIAPLSRQELERLLRPNDLDPSQLPSNDITAISQTNPTLSGTIELNIPDVNPSSGLVNLPTVPVDTQVAQACTPGSSQANSKFVVTGRGGLPPTPNETLNPDALAINWVTLQPESENKHDAATSKSPTTLESQPIVEAQGWIINKKGKVVLTASANIPTPHSSWQTLANCSS